jgi:hypothetical protein
VGVSGPRGLESSAPVVVDAGVRPPAVVPADFREHMTKVAERQSSRGHAGRFDGVVWANDAANGAWDGAGDLPDGSTLVEEAIERGVKGDRAVGLLFMEKKDGAWRFESQGPNGEGPDERSALARCAACHVDAPRDSVFRLPRTGVTGANGADGGT